MQDTPPPATCGEGGGIKEEREVEGERKEGRRITHVSPCKKVWLEREVGVADATQLVTPEAG